MTSNQASPDPQLPLAAGDPNTRAGQVLAFGMIFGLTLGVVLFALTGDRKWVGIGIAFGPLIGVVFAAARWLPLQDQADSR